MTYILNSKLTVFAEKINSSDIEILLGNLLDEKSKFSIATIILGAGIKKEEEKNDEEEKNKYFVDLLRKYKIIHSSNNDQTYTCIYTNQGRATQSLSNSLFHNQENSSIEIWSELKNLTKDTITVSDLLNILINREKSNYPNDSREPYYLNIKEHFSQFKISESGFLQLNEPADLLKNNYQLILTGAPGTGKTYMANHIIPEKLGIKNENIQVKLIQFHPSYDYTDFIEGIRPKLNSTSLEYELKNGSFKEFCRQAGVIERIEASGIEFKNITDENIRDFLKTKKDSANNDLIEFWCKWLKDNKNNENHKYPPFLFIIDEINRAEISKVLGEVMYSIDADYRGKEGKVITQYASCSGNETFYVNTHDDYFFIPSNVYILGTMNDIDRTIEIFDFALRRRFAWKEIKVEDTIDNILKSKFDEDSKFTTSDIECLKEKINYVNNKIIDSDKYPTLNSSYHIGPAYFTKIENYVDNGIDEYSLQCLWDYHIEQILREYLKSYRDIDKDLQSYRKYFITLYDK